MDEVNYLTKEKDEIYAVSIMNKESVIVITENSDNIIISESSGNIDCNLTSDSKMILKKERFDKLVSAYQCMFNPENAREFIPVKAWIPDNPYKYIDIIYEGDRIPNCNYNEEKGGFYYKIGSEMYNLIQNNVSHWMYSPEIPETEEQ